MNWQHPKFLTFPTDMPLSHTAALTYALLLGRARLSQLNGWTDAPNAIATAVGSGAMPFHRAVSLAAVCNFVGTAASCLWFPAAAETMGELVSFPGPYAALAVLNAALLFIVPWAVAAWRFGLPTSESHALLAFILTRLMLG